MHNKAVWTCTTHQAQRFAKQHGQQLVWIRTKDTASARWAEYFLDADSPVKEQKKSLNSNARRRG
eukprot:12321809-Karenia_brevis.AAC.1